MTPASNGTNSSEIHMEHYKLLIEKLPKMKFPKITNNKKISYYNVEAGFDIETTSTNTDDGTKVAFMYKWMVGIGFNSQVYYGNTWEEFVELCTNLQETLNLTEKNRFVIYVHNLGYEFQFMRKYFKWEGVFALSERKPIKALCSLGIEFRDSYVLSGYSLANTAKNLTKHSISKMVGDLEYGLIRTNKTPLTENEVKYCVNDIQIILAYINEQIEQCGNISLIPMTNTGRVRKYVRDMCYYRTADGGKAGKGQYYRYRKIMEDLTLDVPTYTQLKRAFMGGFTHANAKYSGLLLEDVTSIDFTSSYPSVMVSEKFPMTRFKTVEIESLGHLDSLCKEYAVIFDVMLGNVTSKVTQENYISESKCRNISNAKVNNGRIFSADSLTTTITEVDYDIMRACYTWDDISVANVRYAVKGYLPKAIIESILKLYQGKTELKDVAGSEVEYLHSKGMLNSIYGMCVTDVVKDETSYVEEWTVDKPDIEKTINDYNKSENRFLSYAWGIWVTAYARRNLWTGILAIGDDYIYSDTDSLKMLNYQSHQGYIEWFNAQIIEKMNDMCVHYKIDKQLLRPKTKDGVEKTLGIWDYEGTYPRFKTLGAKRYMVESKGKLTLTVAGLSKRNGIEHMTEVAGGDFDKVFEMFDDSLHIPAEKTGKMTHSYVDDEISFKVTDYLGVETQVDVLSGIHLESCEFTLALSDKYVEFVKNSQSGYIFNGGKFQ